MCENPPKFYHNYSKPSGPIKDISCINCAHQKEEEHISPSWPDCFRPGGIGTILVCYKIDRIVRVNWTCRYFEPKEEQKNDM